MTYGFNSRLFVENGPAAQAATVASSRPASRFLPWRKLDPERRLRAIEDALNISPCGRSDLPLAL